LDATPPNAGLLGRGPATGDVLPREVHDSIVGLEPGSIDCPASQIPMNLVPPRPRLGTDQAGDGVPAACEQRDQGRATRDALIFSPAINVKGYSI
jgi:hypothetical protein